jgi:acyl-CoA synthetase (AMP-forming)/AMP-acid ligase II
LVRLPVRPGCGRVRSSVFTTDGWYATGDVGRLDSGGYLWYGGRLDDMVKVSGATVYPSEVEAALRSIAAVAQAHVTDIPGPAGGVEVGAVVITTAAPGEIVAAVRQRLSAFKVPTRWLLTEDPEVVPVSATGKPDKTRLQALLQARGQRMRSN